MKIESVFVYGTLVPGEPNEHVLGALGGSWQSATVTGRLEQRGWGAEMGYPGLVLDGDGEAIKGFVFSSEHLAEHREALDAFEGEQYRKGCSGGFPSRRQLDRSPYLRAQDALSSATADGLWPQAPVRPLASARLPSSDACTDRLCPRSRQWRSASGSGCPR
jgi:gamma-glutamylcyclotransferase (GGCT)/AIG2-like uncharacterized protein YtfP